MRPLGDGKIDEVRSRRIVDLPISVRAKNALYEAGYRTVNDLADKSEGELLKVKKFGRKCLREVKEVLWDLDINLGAPRSPPHPATSAETDALVHRLLELDAAGLAEVLWRLGRRDVAGPWEPFPGTAGRRPDLKLEAMVADGTLTMGPLHGEPDFIVVTDWMPNSAARIREALEPSPDIDGAVRIEPDPDWDEADDSLITLGPAKVGRAGMSWRRGR